MVYKRAYRNLIRHFDESHPTVSAIAPLVCFVVAFTLVILLRLVSYFGAVATMCVETDEFWYSSSGGNWPLVGYFFLTFFLLFAWNILVGFNDWSRSKGSRIMVVVNTIGIVAMLYFFSSLNDTATFAHNSRAGLYDDIKFRPYFIWRRLTEDQCTTMKRFSGRWRVVDRQIGYYGFDIPARWIELKPWGYAYARDASWSQPYAESWRPPYQYAYSGDNRWRDGYLFDAYWDFDLQGDTLILTSPEVWFELEWQRSTITLQREAIPDSTVFANSYVPHR